MSPRTETDLDFLAANIHGRRSRLAEGDRLDELVRLRSVPELIRRVFPDRQILTIEEFQRQLILEQVRELSTVADKIGGAAGRLLDWLCVRFRMENLKVLARGFAAGADLRDLRPYLVPLPEPLTLDVDTLAKAGTFDGFAAVVTPRPLRRGLDRAREPYEADPRAFFVEAGLDAGYFEEMLTRTGGLGGAARGDVLGLAEHETDMFHLSLAVRGAFHYRIDPDLLEGFHVAGTSISAERFARMLRQEKLVEIAELAENAVLDEVPDPSRVTPAPAVVERLAWTRYYRLANRTFRRSHMGLGAVVAYAAIRRIELGNLIRLSEGIRAGLNPRVIRRRLIPSEPG